MNRNLKAALRNSTSEQGFALPLAVGMGMIMIVVGMTMVIRSQEDQITASAQKATSRGQGAAETGITRFQSLINRYKAIATYNACQSWNSSGRCNDTGSTQSWGNASTVPGINSSCSQDTKTVVSTIQAAATTTWQTIDTNDISKGQYRLVSYTYTPNAGITANNAPGTGTLIVEGRVNQNNVGSTATTRLVVNISVSLSPLNDPVPALWVKNSQITGMKNDKVNGNILINSCPPALGATSNNLYDPNTQKVIAEPTPFPDTPALPAFYYTITGSPFNQTFPRPAVAAVPATKETPERPPTPADVPGADGYYHYLIDDLVNSGNGEITISPGKKVIFYVKGNINLSGNPDINKTSGNTPNQLQIYGNTYTSASTTKYGCPTGTSLGSGCPTLIAHFNGNNGIVRAFVDAPDATGSVSDGGDINGNFVGSMWLKDWDASSDNSKVKIDASGVYSDYLIAQNIIKPLISPINSWQRQEASQ